MTPARSTTTDDQAEGVPGERAEKPTEIPAGGWWQIVSRGLAEAKKDQVPLLGAGVAFYAFLALFPGIIALVTIYGFFADPSVIAGQVQSLAALPEEVRQLIVDQVENRDRSALGWGAVISVAVALFSASGGVSQLMLAINAAYDEEESRNFVMQRAIALAVTVGAIVFLSLMLGIVAVLPAVLRGLFGDSPVLGFLLQIGSWLVLVVLVMAALAVLYRVAPQRDAPKVRWVSVGAAVATALWLVGSIGFSLYVTFFGNYAATYGVLAGIVILLFWLWLTSYAVLLGAEINAEAEQQTAADTTRGTPKPAGTRDAVKADAGPGRGSAR